MNIKKILASSMIGVSAFAIFTGVALAGHNGAVVSIDQNVCSPTSFSAEIANPAGTHIVNNMRLVVDDDSTVQNVIVPINGTTAEIVVGPFFQDTTVSWNIFGGGERGYDLPLWNGFGGVTFSSDVNAYAASQGGSFSWVIAGVDDPNPFVNWNEVIVQGCSPVTEDECKNGGWEAFGFRNQGLCLQFVNTGIDSR